VKADVQALLFAAKSFIAAMLAMYISLRLGLPSLLGDRHSLYRLPDIGGCLFEPWPISTGRHGLWSYGNCRHRSEFLE
jgi:hypothetical protein